MHKIVVDIYGADAGPEVIVRGVAAALKQEIAFFPVLVGQAALIRSIMEDAQLPQDRYLSADLQLIKDTGFLFFSYRYYTFNLLYIISLR